MLSLNLAWMVKYTIQYHNVHSSIVTVCIYTKWCSVIQNLYEMVKIIVTVQKCHCEAHRSEAIPLVQKQRLLRYARNDIF